MRKIIKLYLILLPVSVLMFALCFSVARAGSGSFVIGPMQEAVENIDLGFSNQVFGNLSVNEGYIDFFITDASGAGVQAFHNVSRTSFNFVSIENGTYYMRLKNAYQVHDVTVKLDYGISIIVNAQVGVNFGTSLGVAHVIAPISTRPIEPDDGNEPSDSLVEQYLNFLKASEILEMASNARTILPIRNVAFLNIIAFVAAVTIIVRIRTTKFSFDRSRII